MKAEATKQIVTELSLTMSAREALVLLSVCWCVGGAPEGPRGVTDGVALALNALGLTRDRRLEDDLQRCKGIIDLTDEWPEGMI